MFIFQYFNTHFSTCAEFIVLSVATFNSLGVCLCTTLLAMAIGVSCPQMMLFMWSRFPVCLRPPCLMMDSPSLCI